MNPEKSTPDPQEPDEQRRLQLDADREKVRLSFRNFHLVTVAKMGLSRWAKKRQSHRDQPEG